MMCAVSITDRLNEQHHRPRS